MFIAWNMCWAHMQRSLARSLARSSALNDSYHDSWEERKQYRVIMYIMYMSYKYICVLIYDRIQIFFQLCINTSAKDTECNGLLCAKTMKKRHKIALNTTK